MIRKLSLLILTLLALTIAACGTVATPEFSAEAQGTREALAVTSEYLTSIAPTATLTFTPVPPTETPVPPTVTPVPPTETPVPTDAPTATPIPTDVPTQTAPQTAGTSIVIGDAERGKALFNEFRPEVNFACATCHYQDREDQLVGPGLLNVGVRAETRVPGQTAAEYIHNSILTPSAFVVPNFPDQLMPQIYSQVFTEEQISDIIAYLLTLHS